MAEIEITLPTVQYGNVKLRATPEELGLNEGLDAYELGVATSVYLNLFTQGFKHGSTLDVSAPQGASESEVDRVIDETVKAAQAIAEGLGGATVIDEQDPEGPGEAPWDQQVDSPAKPWETEGW